MKNSKTFTMIVCKIFYKIYLSYFLLTNLLKISKMYQLKDEEECTCIQLNANFQQMVCNEEKFEYELKKRPL